MLQIPNDRRKRDPQGDRFKRCVQEELDSFPLEHVVDPFEFPCEPPLSRHKEIETRTLKGGILETRQSRTSFRAAKPFKDHKLVVRSGSELENAFEDFLFERVATANSFGRDGRQDSDPHDDADTLRDTATTCHVSSVIGSCSLKPAKNLTGSNLAPETNLFISSTEKYRLMCVSRKLE